MSACSGVPERTPINTLRPVAVGSLPPAVMFSPVPQTTPRASKAALEARHTHHTIAVPFPPGDGDHSRDAAGMPIAHTSAPAAQTPPTPTASRSTDLFAAFAPGDYRQLAQASQFLNAVNPYRARIDHVVVTGHSHSYRQHASQSLALKRANVVKAALVELGVAADRIDIRGAYSNHNEQGHRLLVGAEVQLILADQDGQPIEMVSTPHPPAAKVYADAPGSDPRTVTAEQRPASSEPAATPAPWAVSPGLLRDTVSRYSHHHGWGLVWQLEEGGEVLDWVIERPFSIARDSLAEGLHTLLGPYADYLQADLCAADKTVVVSRPGATGCTDA